MRKLIRLTETDLHRIVKESVNKILSETINELDPRTYASYADKRRTQGQNDKAFKGTQAAANAWNKEYGYNHNEKLRPGVYADSYQMDDYGYNDSEDLGGREAYDSDINNGAQYAITNDFSDKFLGNVNNTYYPYKDEYFDMHSPTPKNSPLPKRPMGIKNGKGEGTIGVDADTDADLGDNHMRKGLDVAKQMAHGNGKYIKGKGWQ